MSGYCKIAPGHPVHESYHATEYGFPQRDEAVLFERLVLEIMQAASQEMYQHADKNAAPQPEQPAGEAPPETGPSASDQAGKKEDGVIDADFTMVDEEKKKGKK